MEWCTTTFLPPRIHVCTGQEARLSSEVTPATLSQHHQASAPTLTVQYYGCGQKFASQDSVGLDHTEIPAWLQNRLHK